MLFEVTELSTPRLPPSGDWDKLLGEYRMMGVSRKHCCAIDCARVERRHWGRCCPRLMVTRSLLRVWSCVGNGRPPLKTSLF